MKGRALALLAVTALAAALSGMLSPSGAERSGASSEIRLYMEGTSRVRTLYWLRVRLGDYYRRSAVGQDARALEPLRRLAEERPSPDRLRRYALALYAVGDEGWRKTLLRLREVRGQRSLSEVERELALWDAALGTSRPDARQCYEALRFIRGLKLGWFGNVALASLCERCGRDEEARRYQSLAVRSTDHLTLLFALVSALGLAGMVMLIIVLAMAAARRKSGLPVVKLAPLPAVAGSVLVLSGAAYFVALILARVAVPSVLAALRIESLGVEGRILVSALANIVIGLATLAVPVLFLRRAGRRIGLTAADIGLSRPGIARHLSAAIAGYSASLPLLLISLLISASLFDPSSGRINPAAVEFAAAQGWPARALLTILAVGVAPFAEELVFRGVLLRGLQPSYGFLGAAVVTSAIFALLHPQLPMGFLSIFVLGMVFSLLYGVTGSLWPSVFAHAINNAMVFAYLALFLGG